MTARASARLSGQDLIYQDVPPALAEQARRNARDQSDTPGHASWPLDAWPPVPTRFVLCTEDRFFQRAHRRSDLGAPTALEVPAHSMPPDTPAWQVAVTPLLQGGATPPPLQRKGPDPDPFVAQDDDGACAQVLCHLIKVGPDDGRLLSLTAGR